MAGVKLQDHLEPRGSSNFYLLEDIYMLGGFQVVTTKSSTVPPVDHRKLGMYVSETSTGKTWKLTALPDTWEEVIAGTGSLSVLVYQPSGTAGGNVYTDFDDLYAAFQATTGVVTVVFDGSESAGACLINTGSTCDFESRAHFVGIIDATNGVPSITIDGASTLVKNPLSFTNLEITPDGAEDVVTLSFDSASAKVVFNSALLHEGGDPRNVSVAENTSWYLYGYSNTDMDAVSIAASKALTIYVSDKSTVEGNCYGDTSSALTVWLLSGAASVDHDPSGAATYTFTIADGLYEECFYNSGGTGNNNKFANVDLALTNFSAVRSIKTLVLESSMTVNSAGSYDLKTKCIKGIETLLTKPTLTITAGIEVGPSTFEWLNIVMNADVYVSLTSYTKIINCAVSTNNGKKGFQIDWTLNCVLDVQGSSIGSVLSDVPTINYNDTGSNAFFGYLFNSSIGGFAFSKSGGGTPTLTLYKRDPGSSVTTPQFFGFTPGIYRNFAFSGDISGNDTGTQTVDGLYAKAINSGAADPDDKTVLMFNDSANEYQSTVLLEDYLVTSADPVVAMTDPAGHTAYAEVGENLATPTFAVTYTPAYGSSPVPSYCHLKCYDYNDSYPSSPTRDEDISGDPSTPTSAYSFQETTYDRTWKFAVEIQRGIGPVTRRGYLQLTWVNKVYYGVSDVPATPAVYTQDFIKALATSLLSNTAYRSISVNPTGNNHIYYACRTSYGLVGDTNFWIGGFQGGFTDKTQTVVASSSATFADGETSDSITITVGTGDPQVVDLSAVTGGRAGYITALNNGLDDVTVYAYGGSEIIFANDVTGASAPVVEITALGGLAGTKLGVSTGAFNHKVVTTNDTAGTDYSIFESNQTGLGSCTVVIQA